MTKPPDPVEILILGAGWTSTFLIPTLEAVNITYAATSRSGSAPFIPFTFNPTSTDTAPYRSLPAAKTVLITFPIRGSGGSKLFTSLYAETHPTTKPHFLQLGSTSIWPQDGWSNRHSPIDPANERGVAESELLELSGAVLNLSGLWGGNRCPKNWVRRVAPTKEALGQKYSLHLIHGSDVARAIVALHRGFTPGERWCLTDLRVYDWWDLAAAWGVGGAEAKEVSGMQPEWIMELMEERGVRALPRAMEGLGRKLDSMEFWRRFGLMPEMTLTV